jgi:hypothetical protein
MRPLILVVLPRLTNPLGLCLNEPHCQVFGKEGVRLISHRPQSLKDEWGNILLIYYNFKFPL